MSTTATPTTPYYPSKPGDLITADLFNEMQVAIKKDIAAQIVAAIANVKSVETSEDSEKLGGKTVDELTDDILRQALQQFPSRTGYQRLFKRLEKGSERLIEHKLRASPLVDVYQLDYFKVVCAEDDHDSEIMWVNFYLYHSSEKKIRFKTATGPQTIVIEETDERPFRMPFADLLEYYKVAYTNESSVGDLVNEFWKALFKEPNDQFDEDQYCHSPWFDKCCGEQRTVGMLRQRGDWDDLWLKVKPRRTDNYAPTPADAVLAPPNVEVRHYDLDTLGLRIVGDPALYPAPVDSDDAAFDPDINHDQLKLMVLLKV